MREIWSEIHKRLLWRKVWVALAQADRNLASSRVQQLQDLQKHQNGMMVPNGIGDRKKMSNMT